MWENETGIEISGAKSRIVNWIVNNMPKKKNIKKENVLKVLWNECITFKVLIFIIAYVVLAFINMPFEKWLSLYFEWEKLKDYQEVFMEEITLLVILPLMEIAAVALICFIIYEFFCSVSKMIASDEVISIEKEE